MKVRRRGDVVSVSLDATETLLLRTLTEQVRALLDDERAAPADPLEAAVGLADGPVPRPDDPALRRLLPDAYGDDPDAAEEFRRLTDAGLRGGKVAALDRLLADVGAGERADVRLDVDAVEAWLQAVNDVRLVLGVRLDVDEDLTVTAARLGEDDPRFGLLYAYDTLGWLQEQLLRALDG